MLCSVSPAPTSSAPLLDHEFPLSYESTNLHLQALQLLEDSHNQRSFNPPSFMLIDRPQSQTPLIQSSQSQSLISQYQPLQIQYLQSQSPMPQSQSPLIQSKNRRRHRSASQKHIKMYTDKTLNKAANTGGSVS